MANFTDDEENRFYIPRGCIGSQQIELTSPNTVFYKYVLTILPAAGLLLHIAFWSCLATRYVPTLVLYRRLLVVVSVMDAVKLVTYILEATWFIISNFNFLLIKSVTMGTVLRILFAIRTLAIFEVVLVVIWICINCNHDTSVYSSGVTGSLIRKLKDRRCIMGLAIITVIAISLTFLTEIPQQEINEIPYCISFPDGEIHLLHLLRTKDTAVRRVTHTIKACIMPTVFVIFLCGECILIWVKLWRKLIVKASAPYDNLQGTAGEQQRRSQGQIGVVENSQNEIRVTVMFILTPLCIIYFLCWSPHAIINIINEITGLGDSSKRAIKSEMVIWLKTVIELLPSAINPLIFLIAMLRYQSANPQVPNHQRASRETRETNV